jgi:hypothetical protein
MSLPVILRPAADADIQATHDELEQVRAGLGDRFVARVREVLERIEAMPEMYGLVWQDVRAARLRTFRHVVYYVAFADRVERVGGAARRSRFLRLAVAGVSWSTGRTNRRSRPGRHNGIPTRQVNPAGRAAEWGYSAA